MYLSMAGEWKISLEAEEGMQQGTIALPGILQGAGYGNPITRDTPWVSSLHDGFWYQQEPYQYAQGEGQVNVPFLSQPPRHFLGKAYYERTFVVTGSPTGNTVGKAWAGEPGSDQEWYFFAELARWRSTVWVDGVECGSCCSLCTPHEIKLGRIAAGEHRIRVCMDTAMQYPYRPDGHGVSDALGATWNGMAGEIALYTESVHRERIQARQEYARIHVRRVEAEGGRFLVDGQPVYFRATHFGGEYPLTGYPVTEVSWWQNKMKIIKEWGLNAIRFHSCCPPEAAFCAADREDIYLLVECGMWNDFANGERGQEMAGVLREESRRILDFFGHHPSFLFFSSGNEPGGDWYESLTAWVEEIREYDRQLGYEGRRLYTAQSGWHYPMPPSQIEGTDFIYFHRSGYGPYRGGTIRNPLGWKGKTYSPSLEGVQKPVICHELGQWCAYPDFAVIDKFKGYLHPGNYLVFRENARAKGLLGYNREFVTCTGENQLRLYKEELEANFRTRELQGFELLDLHDYLGQGTAVVGFLDAFWENKGYARPEQFRCFCQDTVILAVCRSYVWKNTEQAVIPLWVCHYGREDLKEGVLCWKVVQESGNSYSAGLDGPDGNGSRSGNPGKPQVLYQGELSCEEIARGGNTLAGEIILSFNDIQENVWLRLEVWLEVSKQENQELGSWERISVISQNSWPLHVFAASGAGADTGSDHPNADTIFCYTKSWQEAKAALAQGGAVVYTPYLGDLDYDCPPLSMKNVFWNGQMGPSWGRSLGLVVQDAHPIFSHFPTGHSGGWQWEDILEHARGICMEGMEGIEPVVRPVDDWNRNLSLGLIFEARVLSGKLLVVSADLEGTFEDRPAAYSLKQAILQYTASAAFSPGVVLEPASLEERLFPVHRMEMLTETVYYGEDATVQGGEALVTPDPGTSVTICQQAFPIHVTVRLKSPAEVAGVLYVPGQRDRMTEGMAREYGIFYRDVQSGQMRPGAAGCFPNTRRQQKVMFEETVLTDVIECRIYSAYGCEGRWGWQATGAGWKWMWQPKKVVAQLAGLHVLSPKDLAGDGYGTASGDILFWNQEQKSATKEIEG